MSLLTDLLTSKLIDVITQYNIYFVFLYKDKELN